MFLLHSAKRDKYECVIELTRDNREEEIFTAPEKLPVNVAFQSKPSDNVIKKRKWSDWIHPPFERCKHQKLHFLNGFGLKDILFSLNNLFIKTRIHKFHNPETEQNKKQEEKRNHGIKKHTWRSKRRGT